MSTHNVMQELTRASALGTRAAFPERIVLSGASLSEWKAGGTRACYHNSSGTPMLVTQFSLCHGTNTTTSSFTVGIYPVASGALQSTGGYMTTATSGGTSAAACPIDTTTLSGAYSASYGSTKNNRANLFLLSSISARTIAADGALWMDTAGTITSESLSPWCMTIELVPLA